MIVDQPSPAQPLPGGFKPGERVLSRMSGDLGTVLEPRPGSSLARVDFDVDRCEPWEGLPEHFELVEKPNVCVR